MILPFEVSPFAGEVDVGWVGLKAGWWAQIQNSL